ncbi:MAG: SPFH domain-containing protein [Myxococcota bacterium]
MFWFGWMLGIGAIAALIVQRSFFVVREGEAALVTSFGRPIGPSFGPGLHRRLPWMQVHKVEVNERLIVADYDGTRMVLAHDGTPHKVDATVRYRVQAEHLERYLFGVDHGHDHLVELFECLLRGAVAKLGPTATDPTAFARLRRDRRMVGDEIRRAGANELDAYGVKFQAVDVAKISPPRELEDALNAVLQAEAVARTRLDEAGAECEQQVIAATESVQIAEQNARAVHDEMSAIATILGELHEQRTLSDYVQHRRSEILNQSKTVFVRSER